MKKPNEEIAKVTNSILSRYSQSYKIANDELEILFNAAKQDALGASRIYDTATDYIIGLDMYLKSIAGEQLYKPTVLKDGSVLDVGFDEPPLLISYWLYIGHTKSTWEAAKKKSAAHLAVLEDIELYFAADGTKKALIGVYQKEVALKVLPIVTESAKDTENGKINLNIQINNQMVDLT